MPYWPGAIEGDRNNHCSAEQTSDLPSSLRLIGPLRHPSLCVLQSRNEKIQGRSGFAHQGQKGPHTDKNTASQSGPFIR